MKFTKIVLMGAALSQASIAPLSAAEIPALRILIEDLRSGVAACGITEQSLTATARSVMRYNRVEETKQYIQTDGTRTPILYIVANVGESSNGSCVHSLEVSVRKLTSSQLGGKAVTSTILYCESGSLGLSTLPASSRILEGIRGHIEKCFSEISDL